MCTVEVLLIADVMRRTSFGNDNNNNARPSARSVCRKLFGNDINERRDSSRILRQIEEELNMEMTKKWNFDFQRGTPLPGRYQWEPVGVSKTVSASSAGNQTTASEGSSSQTIAEDAGVMVTEVNCEPQAGPEVAKGCQGKSEEARSTSPKQPKITDFMNQRKRHRDAIMSPKLKVRRTSSSADICTATTTTSASPPAT